MENTNDLQFNPVRPVSPVAPYIGGKKQLASKIISLINRIPHTTYAEPFVGMGGVFLRRTQKPRLEIINDISCEIANLFRILQRHYTPLMDLLSFTFTSRSEFERLIATNPTTLTDLERAARFLYLQRCSFGGKVHGQNFAISLSSPGGFNVSRLKSVLAVLNERLAGVVIDNLNYNQFIERYDRPETLFYLDPPYYGCENDYGFGVFERADFERLAAQLATIQGHFILSLNDTPEVRSIFQAFTLDTVELTYTIGDGAPKPVTEVIITPKGLPLQPEPQGVLI